MSWNYRIVHYRDGTGYGLHEVYYDDEGQAWGMTEQPATFVGDSPCEIVNALLMARTDANKRRIFDEPHVWPGKSPGDEPK